MCLATAKADKSSFCNKRKVGIIRKVEVQKMVIDLRIVMDRNVAPKALMLDVAINPLMAVLL